MRKTKADKYRELQAAGREPETLTQEEFMAKLVDAGRHKDKAERALNPTQRKVLFSSDEINFYMGAAGAAKTSTICAAGWMRALFQPGSKGVVARHDYNKLLMTTKLVMEKMLSLLPPDTLLARDKSPPETWTIKPILEGDPSTIYFMGLKDEIVGFEIDWAVIDECNEVEQKRVLELLARMRNHIPGMPEDVDPTGIYLSCNPPDSSHWLYTAATGKNAKDQIVAKPWMTLYVPEYRENAKNLRKGYYEKLEEKYANAPDLRDRFIRGLWGTTFPGLPVYRQFSHQLHVRRDLPFDPYSTLYRFWDFGYNNPACIFAQIDMEGRLLCLYEELKEKTIITDFAQHVKAVTARQFPGLRERIVDFGDPAVRQMKDTGSTLQDLQAEGITMRYKLSLVDHGVKLIRKLLGQMVNGEPAMQFDELGCPILINALKGGYRLEDTLRQNQKDPQPKKDGFYDHPADAFRYGVINLLDDGVSHEDVENLPTNLGYGGAYSE